MLNFSKYLIPAAMVALVSGCDNNVTTPAPTPIPPTAVEVQYQVTVTNLTNFQPLSPLAIILHDSGDFWTIGQSASMALEKLAESGDNSELLALDFVLSQATNGEVILPGTQAEVMITTTDETAINLSLATMLVNTNDAFTGLNKVDLSSLAVDDMLYFKLPVFDAGTEGNSEMAGTIPGPADGGTGFDEMRNDVDYVAFHSGVVSSDDGLTQSVLTNEHKFDNPAISIKIVRVQ